MSAEDVKRAKLDLIALQEENRMHSAKENASGVDTRGDTICWIRSSDGTPSGDVHNTSLFNIIPPALMRCISLLRGTTYNLESLGYNRSTNHIIPQQVQVGCYAGDKKAAYKAHRDASNDRIWDVGLLGAYVSFRFRCIIF